MALPQPRRRDLLWCDVEGTASSGDGGGERFPLTVTLIPEEIEIAALIGLKRYIRATANNYKSDIGHQIRSDIEASCAEMAVAKALNKYLPLGCSRFKATDVANLHVRHTTDSNGSLIIRPGDPDGVYVLAVGQCPVFRIVGWIHSSDAKRPQYWKAPNGRPGAWFVPQRMLTRSLPPQARADGASVSPPSRLYP